MKTSKFIARKGKYAKYVGDDFPTRHGEKVRLIKRIGNSQSDWQVEFQSDKQSHQCTTKVLQEIETD